MFLHEVLSPQSDVHAVTYVPEIDFISFIFFYAQNGMKKINYFILYFLLCHRSYLSAESLAILRFGESITIFSPCINRSRSIFRSIFTSQNLDLYTGKFIS